MINSLRRLRGTKRLYTLSASCIAISAGLLLTSCEVDGERDMASLLYPGEAWASFEGEDHDRLIEELKAAGGGQRDHPAGGRSSSPAADGPRILFPESPLADRQGKLADRSDADAPRPQLAAVELAADSIGEADEKARAWAIRRSIEMALADASAAPSPYSPSSQDSAGVSARPGDKDREKKPEDVAKAVEETAADTASRAVPPLPPRKPLDPALEDMSRDPFHAARNLETDGPPVPPRRPTNEELAQAREQAEEGPNADVRDAAPTVSASGNDRSPGETSVELHMDPGSDLSQIRDLVHEALRDVEAESTDGEAGEVLPDSRSVVEQTRDELGGPSQIYAMPSMFDFAQWRGDDFLERQETLRTALAEQPGHQDALLDYAQFYAARAMSPESLSLLAELEGDDLEESLDAERQALMEIMQLWKDPAEAHEFSILGNDVYKDWPDWAPWTAYSLASRNIWVGAGELASEGLQRIESYPDELRRPLLIKLVEALAMTGGEVEEVEGALYDLGQLAKDPYDRAAFAYLTALVAEALGKEKEAFEAYLAATQGSGPYAQKARIATVEIGISRGEMGLEEAETLLSHAHEMWRGDGLEIELLKRLAALRLELEDDFGALLALADILGGFPDEPIAEQARENALSLLDNLYLSEGKAGRSLGTRINQHEELRHAFARADLFFPYQEALAVDLENAGLHAAASREYGLLNDAAEHDDDRIYYALEESRALLDGGAPKMAGMLLGAIEEPEDAELRQRWGRLHARIAQSTGVVADLDALLDDANDLQAFVLRGEVAWQEENWSEVLRSYLYIRDYHVEEFGEVEVLRLLLASYRMGEGNLFMEISREHADLISQTEWRQLAQMLIDNPPAISPLGSDEAHEIIDQAEGVRDLIRKALAGGEAEASTVEGV